MPRRPRFDGPGRWFHLMQRGIARRVVFETRADVRYFLACLARAVRRGELEVHAFCILSTHFHLLVRSPDGRLSEAMRRVLNAYVRYYNRTRRRDGALFRGRFTSRPVTSVRYQRVLVRYIAQNPVRARMVARATEFPYGSAWHYVRERRPPWLSTAWVDRVATERGRGSAPAGYAAWFDSALTPAEALLVAARIRRTPTLEDDLDVLFEAAPAAVKAWMLRKATVADGVRPGLAYVSAGTILRVAAQLRGSRWPHWVAATTKGQLRDAWGIAEAALLRHLGGLTQRAIAARVGATPGLIGRRLRRHGTLVSDPAYGDRWAEAVAECLRAAQETVEMRA